MTPQSPLHAGPRGGAGDGAVGSFPIMGGEGEIRIEGLAAAERLRLIDLAVAEARRIEYKYSRYRPDSLLSTINAAAGSGTQLEVDAETAALLDFADRMHAENEGRFDITSGVLRRAWDFRARKIPQPSAVAALLPLIGWSKLNWQPAKDDASRRIALPLPGMELDFGGIGKEYAADRLAALLVDAGARYGYVNLAGDIRVFGPKADGSPWHFGIRDPRRDNAIAASVSLSSGALATSGDYERYIEIAGRRFCHILDPRSGWPVGYWRSVSVLAPLCIAAGALSTVAMLMRKDAQALLRRQGLSYLAIDHRGGRYSDASRQFKWS